MDDTLGPASSAGPEMSDDALWRCLSFDLEIDKDDKRIKSFAGVRADTGRSRIRKEPFANLPDALRELDELAVGADFLLGHNIIRFDLKHLQKVNPKLNLLTMPAVDTLMLNPLAFPRQPYHHLVKHYKEGQIQRQRRNDPELDSRLVLSLFADQQDAFRRTAPELLTAWHWLTTVDGGPGFDRVFSQLRRSPRPSDHEALQAIETRLDGASCSIQAQDLLQNAASHGWEMAYILAWLSVAGGTSVMAPWVSHQFEGTYPLLRRLRDVSCGEPDCGWCGTYHDARQELRRWFGFEDFRPQPKGVDGRPLQRSIVEAVLDGGHVMGVLPTGTGKSICYQLPALSRYRNTGALTVVISPLVALMTDQVAGLEAHDIDSCVTVNGLLSMPERADALEEVRLGEAAILLISPEQLRSTSVTRAIEQREIGLWVMDEAHCLSRWGHDFRPDYRYIARYMKQRHGSVPPTVLCLTATAKPSVKDEITEYFKKELGIELRVMDGGARRTNLSFVVAPTTEATKLDDILRILDADLPENVEGGAIIYCATRRHAEQVADFLGQQGIRSGFFHAGLKPEQKKDTQQKFIDGELRAIAATNAFGMGIDKSNVRLVVHADIPGSLENYLQEAGRAGRDQSRAKCVLLYSEEDVERQFGFATRAQLKRDEINGVLKALRRLNEKNHFGGEVVATVGEILRADEDDDFERDSSTDNTRVRSAVGWLEETNLLDRVQNKVQVFPSSLRAETLQEVHQRLDRYRLPPDRKRRILTICRRLMEADPDEGIFTDELMAASDLTSEDVTDTLEQLVQLGIVSNDTRLTAFVHRGVENDSRQRLGQAVELEEALVALMSVKAPDMQENETHSLQLRHAAKELSKEGCDHATPEGLRRIVRSIAADGRGQGGGEGSLNVRAGDRETLRMTLQRSWSDLVLLAQLRRKGAGAILSHLLSTVPKEQSGTDLLAETTMGDLVDLVRSVPELGGPGRNPARLTQRALLWMHEQEIIRLHRGLSVLRPAMTIRLAPGRRNFTHQNFSQLKLHYDEQVCQVHVMAEYAEQGLRSTAAALQLAMDYFSMSADDFLRRWMPGKNRELSVPTTSESWDSIVGSLNNREQREIVTDDREKTNVLILAGPGSGKTRVLVHRIAYLVRVRRENPKGILALAYNRHAAVEIRRRLAELIGDDARGVTVMTCHAMAMRLTGDSFAGRANQLEQADFKKVLKDATAQLNGSGLPSGEVDENRERLLAGFRWILVDEYQDIGVDEYGLISALAGRTLNDDDDKLSLFAVGDDDQNIYAWNGSSTEFIRSFEEGYQARALYLTDNYRSTAHIITAANAVIEPARDRMKREHPIVVDRARRRDPPGGDWTLLDPTAQGRVQTLPVGRNPITQAQAVVAELRRLSGCDANWDWSRCAVIARAWRYLEPVRALCELERIPVQWAGEEFTGFWFLRETHRLRGWLDGRENGRVHGNELTGWINDQPAGPWIDLLREAVAEYMEETGGRETSVDHLVEWLAEWGQSVRKQQRGLLLVTAHGAKGLEFDHVVVLDGSWNGPGGAEKADEERRLYYVAMTRAKRTLTLARMSGTCPPQDPLRRLPAVLQRRATEAVLAHRPELRRQYRSLSLRDVFLGFAGIREPTDPVHRSIGNLNAGDPLLVRMENSRWDLLDDHGTVVGQLSNAGMNRLPNGVREASATVRAIVSWDKERSDPGFQRNLLSENWEVVIPDLVLE